MVPARRPPHKNVHGSTWDLKPENVEKACLSDCTEALNQRIPCCLTVYRDFKPENLQLSDCLTARRDIKPENLFLGAGHDLKLGDLGLAIDSTLEAPTAQVGTLDYMAPEVQFPAARPGFGGFTACSAQPTATRIKLAGLPFIIQNIVRPLRLS